MTDPITVVPSRVVRALWLVCPLAAASLSAQNLTWTRISAPPSPSARSQHAMAADLARADVVLFGGDDGQALDDTWLWNGARWQQAATILRPSARRGHAMAFDPARRRVVLFGGIDATQTRLDDTWEWDGTNWSMATPSVHPSARDGHAMAKDAANPQVLLFGGVGVAGAQQDTWRWNGVDWTLVPTSAAPVARSGHAMATDTARQRVVLFGGQNPAVGKLGDTWEWNGTGWAPALGVIGMPNPSGRDGHRLAFDERQGVTVLFGGDDGQKLGDTWTFDGSHWTLVATPLPSPTPRRDHAAAYDPARRGVLLFGGRDTAPLGDTWDSEPDARALVYGSGCGTPPLRFVPDLNAPPIVGQTATATILDAPTTLTQVMAGFGNTFYGPFPLPMTLSGIGMTDCDLLQSIEFFGLGTTPVSPGTQSFVQPIPNLAFLIGLHFYLQAYSFAPGQNPAQVIASNGIDWTLSGIAQVQIVEDFNDATQLDADASAGDWAGGLGTFFAIGGDQRHGEFDTAIGTDDGIVNGMQQFTIDCDNTLVPGSSTISGQPILVTDGRFFFSTMVVPSVVRLRFVGTSPPVITVAGRCDILGEIDVAGANVPATPNLTTGQPGGSGGVFGGSGGAGGNRCAGFGVTAGCNGNDGGAAHVLAGHAYAGSVATTGGRGSQLFPTTGFSSQLIYPTPLPSLAYSPSAAAGGGGGGLWTAGVDGVVLGNNHPDPILLVPPRLDAMGPPALGGTAAQFLPVPLGGLPSSLHFLFGGAGGGGAGSHGCLALHLVRTWACGGGGGGGGGAIALRAGDLLRIAPVGSVRANGGSTTGSTGLATSSQPAPGGGGSGGSVVLQSGHLVDVTGPVDVRGGTGGLFDRFANGSPNVVPNSAAVQIKGGDGGDGFVRLEVPGTPTPALLASMLPAAGTQNVAPLAEVDASVSVRSRFYNTGFTSPTFDRYVIDAIVDGVPTTFSDDPAVSPLPATVGAPLRVLFQAATIDLTTGGVLSTGPWRAAVLSSPGTIGIDGDGGNAFRFQLVFDRALASSLTVDRLAVTLH